MNLGENDMENRIVLRDAFKGYTEDQDKIISPEETIRRFRQKIAELELDILEEAVRIDNGRLDIPVYFSVCGRDAREVIGTKKQMGKGATPVQAEASAVMELAERFSFFSFCKNPDNFIVDTYKNLKDRAIPFAMIAKSVHDAVSEDDAACRVFEEIPMQWTRAWNLTRNQEVLIPFTWFFAINEFNGPSAGNCVEEAILQGICEIVERHVSSRVSHDRMRVSAIRPDSATDPMVREMLEKYGRAGVRLFVSDFTLDTGIPTVGILAYDPSTFPEKSEIVWTAGTTPDPQKAFSRALTEVAQLAGDFNSGSRYVASGLPKFASLTEADFVTHPDQEIPIQALPDLSHANIKTEIENCLSALERIGMEVLLIETTHPKLGVPAFYTIIPGAHFRERAANTSVGMFCAKIVAQNESPEKAAVQLERIDGMMPGKYYVKFYLGASHLSLGDPETALRYFTEALDCGASGEDLASIYSYMGICLKDMGQYEKALSVLKKGEEIDSERTDLHNLMGFCYFKMKEHEKAISCFKKIVEMDPSSAIDYANIASNYRDMGNIEQAVHYYQTALALDPGIDFARENLERLRTVFGGNAGPSA
jgi:ribosomal protein S12 methylthiotransferase accessory factor